MSNLTVTVDADVLRRARIRALEEGTSVNAVVRSELERYASPDGADRAADAFLRMAKEHAGASEGRRWSRDDLHLDRLTRR